ncbi:MAG: SDR family NAD(P)-dependent oxidoreductase [Gammaproteobacteria bacterium]
MTAAHMRSSEVVLVTGAAGGIGRAVVSRLRERGLTVVATDAALADLPCAGPVTAFPLDVTDEAAVRAAVARVVSDFGRLDHVVHLAGRAGQGPIDAVDRTEWDALLAVNLGSAVTLARAVHPHLAATRGSLILTASTNALNGGSALSGPAYAVAKAGLVNLMRYLAREWAPQGVRVNCLAPGPIDTPMVTGRFTPEVLAQLRSAVPLGKLGEPRHVAHAVDYLLHPDAAFVTGTVMNVSGGLVFD